MELALQLRAVETMWPLGREDVVSSDDWPDVPFDLGGDPDVGTEKQGLDLLQGPVRAMMKSRLPKHTCAPGTQSPTW